MKLGASDMPQRNRKDIPDLLRAMPVEVSVKEGEICLIGGSYQKITYHLRYS